MKFFRLLISILFLIFLGFSFVTGVGAQHHTCQCTPDCTRTCTYFCSSGCNTTACRVGVVSDLQYSGNGNLEITLSWTGGVYTNEYTVNVTYAGTSTSIAGYPKTGLTVTTDTFIANAGEAYDWSVTPKNDCHTGTTVAGTRIGIPNVITVVLANAEAQSCSNTTCNRADLLVGLDANHDQLIPVAAVVTDNNGATDITSFNVIFDNDTSIANGFFYRVNGTKNGDGTYTIVEDGGGIYQNLAISGASATPVGDTLELNFNLDVSGLANSEFFLSNIYLNAFDTTNISPGRTLRVGAGSFAASETDYPYGTNSVAALDIWNGRDVAVTNVGFYQLDNYLDVCSQVAGWDSLSAVGTKDLLVDYSLTDDWLTNLINWNTSTQYQPYYYYNNQNHQATYSPSADASIFLRGMSSEAYGGPCVEAVAGEVTSNFKNGGVRAEDSGVGDASKRTAFAVIEVADSWSQIYDGSLFSNSDFILGIEPLSCPTCILMDVDNSGNNGLLMANGTINAKNNVTYGRNKDWHAQSVAGNLPFRNLKIDRSFAELKTMYTSGTYTEYSGNQNISSSGTITAITNNQTYFIDGNLTVGSSTLLEVPENNYLLFVVNGDLIITDAVKDSAAATDNKAVEAMFVVYGDILIQDDSSDNNDDLTIEGALVATGNIHFGRSLYTNNNSRPPVKVYFRPDMLGKMAQDNVGIISLQKSLVSQY